MVAKMQVVILAGGLGTRLGLVTERIPKAMVSVRGKPFLQHQISLLRKNRVRDILLCIGHYGDQIRAYFGDGKRFGVELSYSEEGEALLGTGGALKKAETLLADRFFLMWGDSYLLLDYHAIWRAFIDSEAQALMVVYRNNDRGIKSNVTLRDGKVAVYDKWRHHPGMDFIDNGLSALEKSLLGRIPSGVYFEIETLFKDLSLEGGLAAFETGQKYYEIGSLEGIRELEIFLRSQPSKREE